MLDPKKIPLARVKEAFKLNNNDVDGLIAQIWPENVFAWELWGKAYHQYWRDAASNLQFFNIKKPPYPEMDGRWADHLNAWSDKMYGFFTELGFALPVSSLRKGLDYILEETYSDSSSVFVAERESLYAKLAEAENGFNWNQFHPIDREKLDAMLNDKAFSLPHNSYSFISQVFNDSMAVDKLAAVRYLLLCEYPFDHEVKGLTWSYIERVKAALAAEFPIVFSPTVARQSDTFTPSPENNIDSAQVPVPGASATEEQPAGDKNIITVPAILWEGKSPAAVRDAMKDEFAASVIAYVLFNWCKIDKTQIGKLLSEKELTDSKSHRNVANKLLEDAASLTIVKA